MSTQQKCNFLYVSILKNEVARCKKNTFESYGSIRKDNFLDKFQKSSLFTFCPPKFFHKCGKISKDMAQKLKELVLVFKVGAEKVHNLKTLIWKVKSKIDI